jgi:hypothetical protein
MMNGAKVDLWRLEPQDIWLDEICTRLSRLCRYTGALPNFYSVADHSRNLAYLMAIRRDQQRGTAAALMHDMAEAYVGDLVGPIKHGLCPEFIRLEDTVSATVVDALWPDMTFEMLVKPHKDLTRAELNSIRPGCTEVDMQIFYPGTMEESASEMFRMCRDAGIKERG